jgi:sensor domain CHASE-containing protein
LPAAGVLIVAFAAVGLAVVLAGREQDRLAAAQTRSIVEALARQQLTDLERLSLDYSWWDIAVEKLTRTLDPQWADDNIGWYLNDLADIAFTLALSADDRFIYAARDGVQVAGLPFREGLVALAPGFAAVRALDPAAPRGKAGFVNIGGDVYVVGVGTITPEKMPEAAPPGPRAVLALGRKLDGGLLSGLGGDFQISSLALATSGHGGRGRDRDGGQ